MNETNTNDKEQALQDEAELKDADQCMMIGAGIGVAGAIAAVGVGAVCPVCYVAVPALIGAGAVKRMRVRRRQKKQADEKA